MSRTLHPPRLSNRFPIRLPNRFPLRRLPGSVPCWRASVLPHLRGRPLAIVAAALATAFAATPASAWGPDGHHTVGALADRLIAGTPAAAHVHELLDGLSLRDAAVWADCAKGVDPAKDYRYASPGRYPECAVFETADGEAEMSDFVRRNDQNCARKPTEESCHKQYHYTDIAIQRTRYTLGPTGTRPDDIVAAVVAATRMLQRGSAPPPFDFRSPREALLLLAHYVGDIHQPLHVGAIYLDAAGRRVDPDAGAPDAATATRGANQIITVDAVTDERCANLHRVWDDIPARLDDTRIDAAWLARARAVARSMGPLDAWPAAWATESLGQARRAMAGLQFGPLSGGDWTVTPPPSYRARMASVKRAALTRAGARLAQLLLAIWP